MNNSLYLNHEGLDTDIFLQRANAYTCRIILQIIFYDLVF